MENNVKKNMYHIHDKSYKDLYSKKEIALDLFKNFVDKEFMKDLKIEDLELVNKSYISSDYEESESDIVYKAKIGDSEAIFYILLEFQSKIDYTMPLRLLFYMCEILREYVKNEKKDKHDRNVKIPAVVPIVLYNGQYKWDVPSEFKEIFYGAEKFNDGILNFKYDIFDVNNGFTKEELIDKKNATSAIFLLDQKIDLQEFLERVATIAIFFDKLTKEQLKQIKHWIKNTTESSVNEQAIDLLEAKKEDIEKMVANNAFMVQEMKEAVEKKALEIGIKEGLIKGLEQGIEQGIEQGKELGIEQGKLEAAKNLLDILDDETIATKLGLDIEKVRELRGQN
ncbi:MAG: Rpn family recombination-promoting nuclease/putative transposase [Sarcina sp.]